MAYKKVNIDLKLGLVKDDKLNLDPKATTEIENIVKQYDSLIVKLTEIAEKTKKLKVTGVLKSTRGDKMVRYGNKIAAQAASCKQWRDQLLAAYQEDCGEILKLFNEDIELDLKGYGTNHIAKNKNNVDIV